MVKVDNYILDEAEKLFMKFGMRSVTMDDIAKHLSISKKTIYANFKDKNELVLNMVSNMLIKDECNINECHAKAENAIDEIFLVMDFLKEMLSAINPIVFYDLEKYHNEAYKMMMNFHEVRIYSLVKAGLERGIRENIFRSDINVDILATARVAHINWVFQSDLVRSGKYSLYQVIEELTTHFLFGICTLSGHILINNYTNRSKEAI
ncbi:TetR/AcrR family transcriptional regulator [Pedobacter arcticus]|uniref:TetR/AcrR family transcriptional regulator n=1 Tax=Pedobacter arcticus TaxID=752140 RepID=UPI0002DB5BF7|nr:TetR/AcrR family transcriptional regulator [Pedobacter arcticus]